MFLAKHQICNILIMLHSYRVDQMTVNHWVGGSSPSRGAKTFLRIQNKINFTYLPREADFYFLSYSY